MYWYQGKLVEKETLELDINDPALLYGATVFTTMRVYNKSLDSNLTNWQAHCQRLTGSVEAFNWEPPDWKRLRQGAEFLVEHFPVLRMIIFADGREWILGRFLPADLQTKQDKGISVWVADAPLFRRSLPTYKTGNYLGAWLALQQGIKLGSKESILIDEKGNWLETSTGNLWGYKQGCWWTPTIAIGILPGIVRSRLINWLQGKNIAVKENVWSPDFVRDLEAIAYTNCVMELIPFHSVFHSEVEMSFNPHHWAFTQLRDYFKG